MLPSTKSPARVVDHQIVGMMMARPSQSSDLSTSSDPVILTLVPTNKPPTIGRTPRDQLLSRPSYVPKDEWPTNPTVTLVVGRTPPPPQNDLPAGQHHPFVRPAARGIIEALPVEDVLHERDALPPWYAVLGRESVHVAGAVEVVTIEAGAFKAKVLRRSGIGVGWLNLLAGLRVASTLRYRAVDGCIKRMRTRRDGVEVGFKLWRPGSGIRGVEVELHSLKEI